MIGNIIGNIIGSVIGSVDEGDGAVTSHMMRSQDLNLSTLGRLTASLPTTINQKQDPENIENIPIEPQLCCKHVTT